MQWHVLTAVLAMTSVHRLKPHLKTFQQIKTYLVLFLSLVHAYIHMHTTYAVGVNAEQDLETRRLERPWPRTGPRLRAILSTFSFFGL